MSNAANAGDADTVDATTAAVVPPPTRNDLRLNPKEYERAHGQQFVIHRTTTAKNDTMVVI